MSAQQEAYRAYLASAEIVYVVLCSRRWGKTRFAAVLAWMVAIAEPGAIIRYACPTKLHGRKYVIPAFDWLTKLAPAHLRPRWNQQDNCWIWPNGSVCHLGSCESDADVDAQVGTSCDLALVDECGKIKSHHLEKVVESILLPQFLTTKGRCIMLGTPSDSPDHYFKSAVVQAQAAAALTKHTIERCTHVDAEALEKLIKRMGGSKSTKARRELWCEFVPEEGRAVLAEFTAWKERIVVKDRARPRHYDAYVCGDLGFRDLSVIAYGYYDFDEDQIVIEDELVCNLMGAVEVSRLSASKERQLWGTQKPLRRIADTTPGTVADVVRASSRDDDGNPSEPYAWSLPVKTENEAAINRLKTKIGEDRIVIHERCRTIIAHCEHAIWNEGRTEYERVKGHHWDGLDAVKYLIPAVQWGRNPAPALPAITGPDQVISPIAMRNAQRDVRTLADHYRTKGKGR